MKHLSLPTITLFLKGVCTLLTDRSIFRRIFFTLALFYAILSLSISMFFSRKIKAFRLNCITLVGSLNLYEIAMYRSPVTWIHKNSFDFSFATLVDLTVVDLTGLDLCAQAASERS